MNARVVKGNRLMIYFQCRFTQYAISLQFTCLLHIYMILVIDVYDIICCKNLQLGK